ncbi:MAG: MotA/TolQ/ExbB proton channel family protein [Ignavibacteriales bacterium]|nr:MotA/TolQ/ExbB proton channel family protein [Ignavibacteriales bacterium]
MKQSWFVFILLVGAISISSYIHFGIFGTAEPKTILHTIYEGGPLVVVLLTLTIMVITFIFERIFSLAKAQGKGSLVNFLKQVQMQLSDGNLDASIEACEKQRGVMANIIRAGLQRYQSLSKSTKHDSEKKMQEVQRAIEEATMLEMPLLEKNLLAISTIASIATMVGLLGTTIGMIRSFAALARSGAPDAVQLSIGISEALINTAGGLLCAIMAIVAYNFFVNKVDNFTYMLDEASYNVTQTLTTKDSD